MAAPVTLVWLRADLRLDDNPALAAAAERGAVVPCFIHAPQEEAPWEPGAASNWWLHQSLRALAGTLERQGSRLVLRRGDTRAELRDLVRATGASAVFWNRRYEPAVAARDADVERALRDAGIEVSVFNAALLFEPPDITTAAGRPYRVFTPYYKACLAASAPAPASDPPDALIAPHDWPVSVDLAALGLEPRVDWAGGIRASWTPGEAGAQDMLQQALDSVVAAYAARRDRPDEVSTSRLSPHLHFGEIGPRRVWHTVRTLTEGGEPFLRQLIWREFAHHLLHHFPESTDRPLRAEFERFPWRDDPALLDAWRHGRTGYPIVDAGMRELWHTGWMHNRVRMIVASFLVKDLMIPWQEGARWFWDTLVDADLANNTMGWQWTAGCGVDASPWFRVFNPVLQGQRFDPNGDYVRRWVPELASGKGYPRPIVDHARAREAALEAYKRLGPGRELSSGSAGRAPARPRRPRPSPRRPTPAR